MLIHSCYLSFYKTLSYTKKNKPFDGNILSIFGVRPL